MQASTLIARALRLINVPGRGAVLSTTDQSAAFDVLEDILSSESVSKLFQPGIRRHFFPTVAAQDIYSYGPGPGTDFDTRDFDDPSVVRIEDAYIRVGSTLVTNELVSNDRFDDASAWTVGAGWILVNGEAQATAAAATLSQALSGLTIGETYKVKIDAQVFAGSITLDIDVLNIAITGTGNYEFTYVATTDTPTFLVTPTVFTGVVDNCSVRLLSRPERTTLEGKGSDYRIEIIDQKHYNDRFSKGTGGRPYQILFSRNWPTPEIRFDNSPSGPSDILVMDVTVSRVGVTSINSELRVHDEALKWLRYQLAHEMAPEYGKTLSPSAQVERRDAQNRLFASNNRRNTLRVDSALRNRRSFDINRGDP